LFTILISSPAGKTVAVAAESDLLESHGHTVIRYSRSNDEIATTSGPRRLLMVKDIIHSGRSLREMLNLLRSERPDLVHVHNTFMMVSSSVFEACREAGIPAVQTLNNYKLLGPAWSLCREGKVCEECLESGLWRGVWHACYRYTDFIEIIEQALGIKARKTFRPMQPGDVVSTYAHTDDLYEATGFRPTTPIEEGLPKFVHWYREYYAARERVAC
jgi:glycosyl transferase family 4